MFSIREYDSIDKEYFFNVRRNFADVAIRIRGHILYCTVQTTDICCYALSRPSECREVSI